MLTMLHLTSLDSELAVSLDSELAVSSYMYN